VHHLLISAVELLGQALQRTGDAAGAEAARYQLPLLSQKIGTRLVPESITALVCLANRKRSGRKPEEEAPRLPS
jgi:hypothetical protein